MSALAPTIGQIKYQHRKARALKHGLCFECFKYPLQESNLRCVKCAAKVRTLHTARVPAACTICGTSFQGLKYVVDNNTETVCGSTTCISEGIWRAGKQQSLANRFWKYIDNTPGHGPKGECWIWTGSKRFAHRNSSKQYGQIGSGMGGYPIGAHVASYIIHYGPIPDGMSICHSCDYPPCANPDHLSAKTHQENLQEYVLRGALVEEISLTDFNTDTFVITPFEETESTINRDQLRPLLFNALDKLKPRHREVIIRRFGLDGNGERTLEEIGKDFNVTRERIRQIEANAMARLRLPAIHGDLRAVFEGKQLAA